MSRTFKTRPYWVRLNDPAEGAVIRHYHERGVCDAHVKVTAENHHWRHPDNPNCFLYLRESGHYGDSGRGQTYRKNWFSRDRTSQRVINRTMLRAARTNDVEHFEDIIDNRQFYRDPWW